MSNEKGARLFGEYWAKSVRWEAERAFTALSTGKGARVPNPFEERYFLVDPAVKLVADKLNAVGLHKDREFLTALEGAVRVIAAAPIAQFLGDMASLEKYGDGGPDCGSIEITDGSGSLEMTSVFQAFEAKLGNI